MTIILPEKSKTFLYQASILWNIIHKKIIDTCKGIEASVNVVKLRSKNVILDCQAVGENDHWTEKNFQLFLPEASDTNLILHKNTVLDQNNSQAIDVLH